MAVAQSVRDNEREVSIILTFYQEKEQCQREREKQENITLTKRQYVMMEMSTWMQLRSA